MTLDDKIYKEDYPESKDMGFCIYNTLTRKKEKFKPMRSGKINIYVCGVTTYDHCHIGHAKTAIAFDMAKRYFEYKGYEVFYVCNITDVGHIIEDADIGEDKIEKRAKERRLDPMELVDFYTKSMWEDFDALRIDRPNIAPRATGHIIEMIDVIQKLLEKGYAYEVKGSVYFDIDNFLKDNSNTDFGKLSRKKLKDQLAGARIEIHPDKKNPYDFALWKKAEPNHIMQWTSPWGKGYPGWHIECSTMSTKYLGQPFDIHGGGIEHAMLHHECEIAQAEGSSGKKFVNYWMHVGMLNIDGQKMSKSLGNFITIKDALKAHGSEAIRMLFAQTQYKSPLNYTEKSIEGAKNAVERLNNFVELIREASRDPQKNHNSAITELTKKARNGLEKAMDDDFNTPVALAKVFQYSTQINKYISEGKFDKENVEEVWSFMREFDSIFKIFRTEESKPRVDEKFIHELTMVREDLRKRKDYEASDKIRSALKGIGAILEDTEKKPRVSLR